jgi:hypothetical protein
MGKRWILLILWDVISGREIRTSAFLVEARLSADGSKLAGFDSKGFVVIGVPECYIRCLGNKIS